MVPGPGSALPGAKSYPRRERAFSVRPDLHAAPRAMRGLPAIRLGWCASRGGESWSATEIAVGVPLSGRFADEWAALDLAASCEPNTSLEWARALAAAHFEPTDDFLTIAQRAAG